MTSQMRKPTVLFLTFLSLVLFSGCSAVEDPLDEYRNEGYPIVLSMSPTGGTVGQEIVMLGENFGEEQGNGVIMVYCASNGSAVNAAIEWWADDRIVYRIPSPANLDARYLVRVKNDQNKECPYDQYVDIVSGLQ